MCTLLKRKRRKQRHPSVSLSSHADLCGVSTRVSLHASERLTGYLLAHDTYVHKNVGDMDKGRFSTDAV